MIQNFLRLPNVLNPSLKAILFFNKKMKLRYYQREAVNATWKYLAEHHGFPCLVMPTGSGKTPVIAALAKEVAQSGDRVLILSHVKELIEQNAEKLNAIAPELNFGIYSAGLNSRDTTNNVIIAGIQSVYDKAELLGTFSLVIVDECHLITNTSTGMYRTLIAELRHINPQLSLVGLTATPYRLSSGLIYGEDQLFEGIAYDISIPSLIAGGFLSPIISKASRHEINTDSLHIQRGEFKPDEAEKLFSERDNVANACYEIINASKNRKSVLIFCSGVEHAKTIVKTLKTKTDQPIGLITGDTPTHERDKLITRFRRDHTQDFFGDSLPPLKYLVNVNVLTTGFDAPNVDCVVLLRATMSPGLYYQMVGRGFRINEGKEDCLILDFGNNILRHGPVDAIQVRNKKDSESLNKYDKMGKKCPECQTVVTINIRICPDCGHVFVADASFNHDGKSSDNAILSNQRNPIELFEVVHTSASAYFNKHDHNKPPTMQVSYTYDYTKPPINQWLCFDHPPGSFAHSIARKWWANASYVECPKSVNEAVKLFNKKACAQVEQVKCQLEGKYYKIIDLIWGEKPIFDPYDEYDESDYCEYDESDYEDSDSVNWDEVPF
jgi:DNA repair protein RadD